MSTEALLAYSSTEPESLPKSFWRDPAGDWTGFFFPAIEHVLDHFWGNVVYRFRRNFSDL